MCSSDLGPAGDVGTVSVHEGLKQAPIESAEVAVKLRDAEAASTYTLVAMAHPTWTQEQIEEELARMEADGTAMSAIE